MRSGGYALNPPSQWDNLHTSWSTAPKQSSVLMSCGTHPAVEQYDEGIFEGSKRVDIDGLEEARCAALVQSARYLEGI
jgi:hypothetical protein